MPHLRNRFCFSLYFSIFIFFSAYSSSNGNPTVEELCYALQSPTSVLINHLAQSLTNTFSENENLFFSPLSLSLALGMVYLGASGNTAQQLRNVLLYNLVESDETVDDVHRHFRSLLIALSHSHEEYNLLIANSMYTQTGYIVRQQYSEDLQHYYKAKQESLDFMHNGTEALRAINQWVSNKTEGKIPDFFKRPLNPQTVMVLLNAVYFKGFWKIPFSDQLTHERNFYGVSGVKRMMFMQFTKNVYFYQDAVTNHDFLELQYKGNHMSMIFALPRTETGNNVTNLDLNMMAVCRIRAGFRKTLTNVFIPKFKLSFERELSQDLKQLGLTDMFDPEKANFAGIREERDVSVSLIQHKALIDVNEQGSEALASSGVVFFSRSGHVMHNVFIADHPFKFFILDKRTGSILFMGRINDP